VQKGRWPALDEVAVSEHQWSRNQLYSKACSVFADPLVSLDYLVAYQGSGMR
jgi:hypothetical protein